MSKKAFDKIAEGLADAISIARGDIQPARLHVPPELDVKAIRKRTSLSQEVFSYTFGFTIEQIRSWEQGRSRPVGGLRAYLLMIENDPVAVRKMLDETRKIKAA